MAIWRRCLLLASLGLVHAGCHDTVPMNDVPVDAVSSADAVSAVDDAAPCAPATPLFLDRTPGTFGPGATDAATDTIPFVTQPTAVTPTRYDDAQWEALVACVSGAVAPFNVHVVESEPAGGAYTEVAIADRSWLGGGGPVQEDFIAEATCTPPARPVAFVFTGSEPTDTPIDYCKDVVAVWAMATARLDHAVQPARGIDYLTWNGFTGTVATWIDHPLACGDNEPRMCRCGGATQHSYASLLALYGPACTE